MSASLPPMAPASGTAPLLTLAERILDALPEAVLAIGPDDRILCANPPALVLFPNLSPGAPIARHLRSPDVLDAITRVRRSGTPARASWQERVPVERLFDVTVAPVAEPRESMILIYLRETSETRRFERMRVDFIANASHELRTPLASLLGFIETLQGPARNDERARSRFLKLMREQAQRMARLVDDLLSLSRIEQHAHLQPKTPVDLVSVVRHIADTLLPLAHDREVDLALLMDEPIIVAGDRDELMRVAENLIENAIKYGAGDGTDRRVEISVGKADHEASLVVRDFGPGIAPEHIPRLTERFYRVDAGLSRAKGGTGLGLALVKHVVARHRGRLSIQSVLGQETTFTVQLPLYEELKTEPARHKTVASAS